jgi:hypothetical protein
VLPNRRARRVEQARLGDQHEWLFGGLAAPHLALRGCHLFQRAANVHRAGATALGRRPRDRAVQSKIHFEDARPVAITLQRLAVGGRQSGARDFEQLARRHVQKNGLSRRQFVQRLHGRIGDDLHAE